MEYLYGLTTIGGATVMFMFEAFRAEAMVRWITTVPVLFMALGLTYWFRRALAWYRALDLRSRDSHWYPSLVGFTAVGMWGIFVMAATFAIQALLAPDAYAVRETAVALSRLTGGQ